MLLPFAGKLHSMFWLDAFYRQAAQHILHALRTQANCMVARLICSFRKCWKRCCVGPPIQNFKSIVAWSVFSSSPLKQFCQSASHCFVFVGPKIFHRVATLTQVRHRWSLGTMCQSLFSGYKAKACSNSLYWSSIFWPAFFKA